MKNLNSQKRPTSILFAVLISFLIPISNSCSKEDNLINEVNIEADTDDETSSACTNPLDLVFNEKDGLVSVEFEEAEFSDDWAMKSDGNSFSGKGYMVWEGNQNLHEPGSGSATFKIKIATSGTYQFLWNSAVKSGNSATDHNDTWLRFADASKFYGKKGSSTIYPKDSGRTPNPNGSSKDGWFKIFRTGNDLDFKWNALTSDHDGHEIFVDFDAPGTYIMEISARSSGHGIDKFVLFNNTLSSDEATSNTESSSITCN